MSVVAWDGRTLAADRQCTNNGLREKVRKIFKEEDGTVLAFVGPVAEGLLMVQWYREGADLLRYPSPQADDRRYARLIVVPPRVSDILLFEQPPIAVRLPWSDKFAFGSGRDYALGAMFAGVSAPSAVEITNALCIECGFGVEYFTPGKEQHV